MGRRKITEEKECAQPDPDPTVRRSTRKRKPTKHSDYDYTNRELDCKTPKTIKSTASKLKPSPAQSTPVRPTIVAKSAKTTRVMKPDRSVKAGSNSGSCSSNNTSTSSSASGQTSSSDSLPLLNVFSPSHEAWRQDISNMHPKEIIDVHCQNLETRLKNIAYKYLRSWLPPPPRFVAPFSLVVGDTKRYPVAEPDDIAVQKVIHDLLNAVSITVGQ